MSTQDKQKSGRVDQQTWDRLVEAFRDHPGNYLRASRLAGVTRRTARRAYEEGYPERPFGVRSIRTLIEEEAAVARSRTQLVAERAELEDERLMLEAEQDREAARQHAARARTEEATLISATRQSIMRGLASALEAGPGIKAAMKRMSDEMVSVADAGGVLGPKERAFISAAARRYSSMLRDLTQAGQVVMEMERLYLGEPTKILGVDTDLDAATTADLIRMAGYQDAVLQRAAARGTIDLPTSTAQSRPDPGKAN